MANGLDCLSSKDLERLRPRFPAYVVSLAHTDSLPLWSSRRPPFSVPLSGLHSGGVFDLVPLNTFRTDGGTTGSDRTNRSEGESPFQKPWKVPGTSSGSPGPRPPPQPVKVRPPCPLLHSHCQSHGAHMGTAGPAHGPDGPTGPAEPRPA